MSISGSLLDVSVADVMQFIHLGRRTGTLVIESGRKKAEIGFHRGRIISAWTPEAKRIGDLLLDSSDLDRQSLDAALARQDAQVPRMSLGKMLVVDGMVTKDRLREVVCDQIERTIYDLVGWHSGRFEFAMDELRPVDDIAVYPGDILPDINLNTQIVVLEALRIFDERNRDRHLGKEDSEDLPGDEPETGSADASAGEAIDEDEAVDLALLFGGGDETGDPSSDPATRGPGSTPVRFQVVSEDLELLSALEDLIDEDTARVVGVRLWDAGLTLPGEAPPVVLVDLRQGAVGLEDLVGFRRARRHAAIVATVGSSAQTSDVYEAGAVAVVPPEAAAVVACVRSLVRHRSDRAGMLTDPAGGGGGYAKLRRVVADLRSGLLSATVALNLMQVISESVERAVMFAPRRQDLVALGAFGFSHDGRPLAAVTRELSLPLERGNALSEAMESGQTRSTMFEDAGLPEAFTKIVGRPRTGQVVIFPVLGSERVNSVVYTDNGSLSREIEEIEILELAAAQVGVAFENELLRRRMEQLSEVAT